MTPHSHFPARVWWIVLATAGLVAISAAVASASTVQEEREGAVVLREVEGSKLPCEEASAEDFERVGEYVMGRMLGSPESHGAMDEAMSRMMGSGSEPQVHEAMGRRYTGCGGGQLPSGFGRMMGAFNAMGMMGGGMMEGLGLRDGYGPSSSMMGGNRSGASSSDDDFDGPSAAAMVGVMAVLIGAVAVAVLLLGRRRPQRPLDTLQRRFATDDMTREEYEERRRLLGGS